jgi:radical SAM family RiPP maturation amino acid epimerase
MSLYLQLIGGDPTESDGETGSTESAGFTDAIPDYDLCALPPLVAQVKRFVERWVADAKFRAALAEAPDQAVAQWGLDVSPEDLRYLWDEDYRRTVLAQGAARAVATATPACMALFGWVKATHRSRARMIEDCQPADPVIRQWRERQMARAQTTFRKEYNEITPHIAFTIELSRGCSVGCWFCGVTAPALSDVFERTPQNIALFRGVIEALQQRFGSKAARWGFLYWASDPFDNRDYEAFALDFKEAIGGFPITTTALGLRDLERTKHFLQIAKENEAVRTRFSLMSVRQLDQLHTNFSAEEMAGIEVTALNKGSLLKHSASGRARTSAKLDQNEEAKDQTIACVSGFLINMVAGSIQLISPCVATDRWPSGYIVFGERSFASGEEFAEAIDDLIATCMPTRVDEAQVARFRRDLRYEAIVDGFRLTGRGGHQIFGGNSLLHDLGELIAGGEKSYREIVDTFDAHYPLGGDVATSWLHDLFVAGVLDEEPTPP